MRKIIYGKIPGMNSISLFQLNNLIKQTLDLNLEPSYWVVAEIGEIRLNQKGHCYLELVEKEEDHITAKIKATIWAYTYRNICGWFESITGKSLHPGMKVLAQVSVSYHEVYGISLNIKDIDPNFTLGERARKKQEVIERLKNDGVFEMNKELSLPLVPQRIAVISSPSAAGYEDFVMQLLHNPRNYKPSISLFKAMMQGGEAKESIINALQEIYDEIDQFDILVIIRGGGSQVDLDCFDTYDLACHVAQFPLPVVTGIGHERDETVVDLVAHTQMKTPTAVAEFIISGFESFEEVLTHHLTRIVGMISNKLNNELQLINDLTHRLRYSGKNHLSESKYHLSTLRSSIKQHSKAHLKAHEQKLSHRREQVLAFVRTRISEEKNRLQFLEKNLVLFHPQSILRRGFSITRINHIPLNNAIEIKPGDVIHTETNKGLYTSQIETITPKI